jgi:hypothetical protein
MQPKTEGTAQFVAWGHPHLIFRKAWRQGSGFSQLIKQYSQQENLSLGQYPASPNAIIFENTVHLQTSTKLTALRPVGYGSYWQWPLVVISWLQ